MASWGEQAAIPKLQAQLTSYQTLKQELKAQIVKGQELIKDQEKPDLGNLTQAVEDCQESYDKQLAKVSVMEQGLKDATTTYQAAKTLQDSNQEAFKAHQELSDLVKVVKGENTALTDDSILKSMLSVSISNKSWTMPMPTTSVS